MATITLDPLPLKPYASLLATIRIARLVQEFRRRLKARVQTHKKAKQSHAQYRRTFKSRASSEFEGVFKRCGRPNVCSEWSRQPDDENQPGSWFKELLEELDKTTRPGKDPLCKTAADENLFLHHNLRLDTNGISLYELIRCYPLVTALLQQLSHQRRCSDLKGQLTSGKDIADGDFSDEKFLANLEHLLRRLQDILVTLAIQKCIEVLDIEALYWQQHLDDGLFAEGPSRRQHISSTWPWDIRTALLVLWGVCWMFYDPIRNSSRAAQNPFVIDPSWGERSYDDTHNIDLFSESLFAAQNFSPSSSSSLLEGARIGGGPLSESSGFPAPQQPRQQGDESIFDIDRQWPYGHRNSSDFDSYNNASISRSVYSSDFATSTSHGTSGGNFSDQSNQLNSDAWQTQPNQLYPPRPEAVPSLTLQTPDAAEIYSPQGPWITEQNKFPDLNEADYEISMPDSGTLPSPESEGSIYPLRSRRPSFEGSTVMSTVVNPDQTSPSSVGSVGRPRLSLKRDQEPPRNEGGHITCTHLDCTRTKPPTFLRKCEWSKHMDKHDRPYICTEPGCEKIRGFTYSGGLLRHQREVHKKHGGPKTALMCLDPHCKRSTGVGFTRKENLVEHERRVHRKDALGQSSTNQYIHQHRKVAVSDDKDGEDGTSTRKRKRSVDDVQWTPAGFVKEEGGGDLRDEVKRLKRENEEKDRKLKNLEAFVAGLKQSMQAHSSSS